jgi:hypothetical protein
MTKRLNFAFSDEEHQWLLNNKNQLRESLKLDKLSWEKYFLMASDFTSKEEITK